jgi:hypothetical protein
MSLLAFALGGGGQLGVKIFKNIFEYYKEKQQLEKLRIQSNAAHPVCNVDFQCNYIPNDFKGKRAFFQDGQKKFKFLIAASILAVCGITADLIIQLTNIDTLGELSKSLESLRTSSYEVISFIIAWIFTEKSIDKTSVKK